MGVDDWIAREGHICPKCKAPNCERWAIEQKLAVAPMLVVQKWWMDKWNEDCAFRANACPECKGKCCRDTDYGCRVYHMGAEVYSHWCDYCHDGTMPKPDPRDEQIAHLSAERERLIEKLKRIENLSRLAWEQVDSNPQEAKELFRMINMVAK